jgi:hypothetical protein
MKCGYKVVSAEVIVAEHLYHPLPSAEIAYPVPVGAGETVLEEVSKEPSPVRLNTAV